MYSYVTATRATGKRGHGGKSYRPPPQRKDRNTTPPPLKQCDCLVELDVPEYMQRQPQGRAHECMGGRLSMEKCAALVRSLGGCHLQIPGRNDDGRPCAIVAASFREALIGVHLFMSSITNSDWNQVIGRVHLNVKQELPVVTGVFFRIVTPSGCLFRSDTPSLAVAVYNFQVYNPVIMPSFSQDEEISRHEEQRNILQTETDNLCFRDSSCRYEMLPTSLAIFWIGSGDAIDKLLVEIQKDGVSI